MQEFTSETEFKFGDGKVVASEKSVVIPCNAEGKNVSLKTDVVKSEITLSLSKESKKITELKIDFVNDRTNIFGKDIHLHFTTSGHYAIPLNETNLNLKTSSVEDSNFVEVLLAIDNIEEKSKKEIKYIAIKLHKQFGHPKSARLIDLIKTVGTSDKDMLDMVKDLDKSCEICMRYKRPSSRPVVEFSLAHGFNETVAIDLKHWVAIFGTPTFLSDNRGEFTNELFREMGKQFNINIKSTAAESPWSNDIVEKQNGVIGNMIEKVMSHVRCRYKR